MSAATRQTKGKILRDRNVQTTRSMIGEENPVTTTVTNSHKARKTRSSIAVSKLDSKNTPNRIRKLCDQRTEGLIGSRTKLRTRQTVDSGHSARESQNIEPSPTSGPDVDIVCPPPDIENALAALTIDMDMKPASRKKTGSRGTEGSVRTEGQKGQGKERSQKREKEGVKREAMEVESVADDPDSVMKEVQRKLLQSHSSVHACQTPHIRKLHELVGTFLEQKQGDSFLISGEEDCDKFKVLTDAIETCGAGKTFKTVKLNGLIQTDGKVALKEIFRQLSSNAQLHKNAAITEEALYELLDTLKCPLIFVLEDFHLFAQHPGQGLVYSLLEATQSSRTPILVIGITSSLDVRDLLEKRVRSRLSQSVVYFGRKPEFEEFVEEAKKLLLSAGHTKEHVEWNKTITSLVVLAEVKEPLRKLFVRTQSIANLKEFLLLVCHVNNDEDEVLKAWDFENAYSLFDFDPIFSVIKGLSVPELAILVTAAKYLAISRGDSFSFEVIFEKYRKFANQKCKMLPRDRQFVMKVMEQLESLEMILPASEVVSKNSQKAYQPMQLQIAPDYILESVADGWILSPSYLKSWAKTKGFF